MSTIVRPSGTVNSLRRGQLGRQTNGRAPGAWRASDRSTVVIEWGSLWRTRENYPGSIGHSSERSGRLSIACVSDAVSPRPAMCRSHRVGDPGRDSTKVHDSDQEPPIGSVDEVRLLLPGLPVEATVTARPSGPCQRHGWPTLRPRLVGRCAGSAKALMGVEGVLGDGIPALRCTVHESKVTSLRMTAKPGIRCLFLSC